MRATVGLVGPLLLLGACAPPLAQAPHPQSTESRDLPAGAPTSLFNTEPAGDPAIEARLFGPNCPGVLCAANVPVLVARGAADLERAGIRLRTPVDFQRSLVVIAWRDVPPTGALDVVAAPVDARATSPAVRVWKAGPEVVQVEYAAECQFCGGASIDQDLRLQCLRQVPPAMAYTVPRPRRTLVLGVSLPCDLRAP